MGQFPFGQLSFRTEYVVTGNDVIHTVAGRIPLRGVLRSGLSTLPFYYTQWPALTQQDSPALSLFRFQRNKMFPVDS